jgi:hypothetical protein
MRKRNHWRTILCSVLGAAWFFSLTLTVRAQCPSGEILIGEDEHYWYCSSPRPPEEAASAIEQINQHLLGPEWRYRKAVMDAVGSLARPPGVHYLWGGKLRIESGGRVQWICVSDECAGAPDNGIDCSGLTEYGAHSACFVRGISSFAGLSVHGVMGNAAQQASYFASKRAFIGPAGNPNPGDFIFFQNTVPGRTGITHVGIFLGRFTDGTILIVHASSRAKRVIFDKLSPGGNLRAKIAGYGDVSILNPP